MARDIPCLINRETSRANVVQANQFQFEKLLQGNVAVGVLAVRVALAITQVGWLAALGDTLELGADMGARPISCPSSTAPAAAGHRYLRNLVLFMTTTTDVCVDAGNPK